MRFTRTAIASLAIFASVGANAAVVGSLGGQTNLALQLSLSSTAVGSPCGTCALGGAVATISGGTIYSSDQPFADIPAGGVKDSLFLAAGPSGPTQPSTMTFLVPTVTYLSFLWGSPDTYNQLTVTTNLSGPAVFTAAGLSFAVTNGNQAFSQYVNFVTTLAGEWITSVKFDNIPAVNSFEVANFSIVKNVPEPGSLALLGAGLLGMGLVARRRKVRADLGMSAA